MKPIKHIANTLLRPFNYETVQLGHRKNSDPFRFQSDFIKKKDPLVFDGGANRGDLTARYRKWFPKCTLHLFEPFPATFQVLKQRYEAVPNIKLNEMALSDVDGTATFNENEADVTNSLFESDPLAEKSWGEGSMKTKAKLTVTTTTIDTYCKANSISRIDILKLDIQGAELRALQGARSMLDKKQIGLIYMEMILCPTYVGQPEFEDYLRFLRDKGYVLMDIFYPRRKDSRLILLDVIFAPSPLHASAGANGR